MPEASLDTTHKIKIGFVVEEETKTLGKQDVDVIYDIVDILTSNFKANSYPKNIGNFRCLKFNASKEPSMLINTKQWAAIINFILTLGVSLSVFISLNQETSTGQWMVAIGSAVLVLQ